MLRSSCSTVSTEDDEWSLKTVLFYQFANPELDSSYFSNLGFLNLAVIDILDWVILGCGTLL